ncbi:hypothetical protein ABIQ69_11320 [Agromyces sp. G08B096]|uniref:Uncharacterized protein n=1 Tax=Agromyces sp. G08B096 TaxID=3156399 RepID=A0AAU7W5J7_9MICO
MTFYDIDEPVVEGRTTTITYRVAETNPNGPTQVTTHLLSVCPTDITVELRQDDTIITLPEGEYLAVLLERASHAVIDGHGFTFTGPLAEDPDTVGAVIVDAPLVDLVLEAITRATREDVFNPMPFIRDMFAPFKGGPAW